MVVKASSRFLWRGLRLGWLLLVLPFAASSAFAEVIIRKIDRLHFPQITCHIELKDESGHAITTMGTQDIHLLESTPSGDTPITADHWEAPGTIPLTIAIVLDYSGSMLTPRSQPKWLAARNVALAIVRQFKPGDQALVETFSITRDKSTHNLRMDILPICPLTSNTDRLNQAIRELKEPPDDGATPLCDGVWNAVDALTDKPGKRVIFLITDGEQNTANYSGAREDFDNLIRTARERQIEIDVCGYGDASRPSDLYNGINIPLLNMMATGTGGQSWVSAQEDKIQQLFLARAQTLREEYVVTFHTSRPKEDGTNRILTVNTSEYGNARKDYQAPGVVSAEFDPAAFFVFLAAIFVGLKLVPATFGRRG